MPQDRILFLAANPSGTTKLALAEECADVERELRMATYRDFKFASGWATTVDGMMRHLNALQPTIIHFSGHGVGKERVHVDSHVTSRDVIAPHDQETSVSGIYLQDERGAAQFVNVAALTKMIKSAASSVRLVVLNACYSETQANVLCGVVDCVVGMAGAIDDDSARAFAVAFYRALGHRHSIGNAVEQAIATLAGKQLPSEQLPRCHTRNGVDAYDIFLGKGEVGDNGDDADDAQEIVESRYPTDVPVARAPPPPVKRGGAGLVIATVVMSGGILAATLAMYRKDQSPNAARASGWSDSIAMPSSDAALKLPVGQPPVGVMPKLPAVDDGPPVGQFISTEVKPVVLGPQEYHLTIRNTGVHGKLYIVVIAIDEEGSILRRWENTAYFDSQEQRTVVIQLFGLEIWHVLDFRHFKGLVAFNVAESVWNSLSADDREKHIKELADRHAPSTIGSVTRLP